MTYSVGALVILFLFMQILGLFILGLLFFVKKVKHGWLYLILLLFLLFFGICIYNRYNNRTFYDFRKEVCNTYPEIENIKLGLSRKGEICTINVYVADGTNDETIENIVIVLLKSVNKEPLSTYFKRSGTSKKLIMEIYFWGGSHFRLRSGQYQRADWFTAENQKVQTWKSINTTDEYHFSDLLN